MKLTCKYTKNNWKIIKKSRPLSPRAGAGERAAASESGFRAMLPRAAPCPGRSSREGPSVLFPGVGAAWELRGSYEGATAAVGAGAGRRPEGSEGEGAAAVPKGFFDPVFQSVV